MRKLIFISVEELNANSSHHISLESSGFRLRTLECSMTHHIRVRKVVFSFLNSHDFVAEVGELCLVGGGSSG